MERGTICLSVRNSQSVAQRERETKDWLGQFHWVWESRNPRLKLKTEFPRPTTWLRMHSEPTTGHHVSPGRQGGLGFPALCTTYWPKEGCIPELIDSNLEASSLKPTEISCVFTHLAIPKCVNKRLLCNQSLILVSSLLQIFKGFFKSVVDLFGVNEMLLEKIHMEEWATLVRRQIRHFLRLR